MSWGAVASAGIGAASSLLGGGGGEKVHPMDAIPKHLRDDYMQLSGQIAGMPMPEYYQGQLIADQNPWMQGTLAGMYGYGQEGGMGYNTAQGLYGAGQQALGGYGQAIDYMQGMQERGPNQFQYDQQTYDQSFNNLTGGMQNAFDQGAKQLQQNFEWGDLKNLNMGNALTGGQGNTKFGQAGALGQAMANQNIQNFGTSMWQNAANQANQGAMAGGMQNLNQHNLFDRSMMGGYMGLGNAGANMMGQAYDMGRQNLGLGFAAGDYQQRYNQSLIDAEKTKWDFEQNAPMMHLQNQLGMMPGPGGFAPATPGMSVGQGIMGGLGSYLMGGGQMPDFGSIFGGGSFQPQTGVDGLNYAIPFSGGSNL
jgi:hypothetical protein